MKEFGFLKNNLLFRLITGKISVEDLQERQDYVDLPLENCNYQIAVIKFSARHHGFRTIAGQTASEFCDSPFILLSGYLSDYGLHRAFFVSSLL